MVCLNFQVLSSPLLQVFKLRLQDLNLQRPARGCRQRESLHWIVEKSQLLSLLLSSRFSSNLAWLWFIWHWAGVESASSYIRVRFATVSESQWNLYLAQMSILGVHSCWVGNSDPAKGKEGNPAVFDSSLCCVAKVTITLQLALTFKEKPTHPLSYTG